MNDSVGVTMLDTLQDLLDACRGVDLAVKFSSHNVLKEFTAGDQVKDKVVVVLLLNDKSELLGLLICPDDSIHTCDSFELVQPRYLDILVSEPYFNVIVILEYLHSYDSSNL